MFPDPVQLDLLSRFRPQRAAASLITIPTTPEKLAFSPSPGMQQAVMQQAQGAPPPGDPAAGGAPPGGPPPGDPMAAAGGGGAPPADPNVPAGPSPTDAKLDQMMQMFQQYMQQGGQPGAGGKGTAASVKIEPAHFQQVTHDMATVKSVLTQMADQLGLQVPASELLNQPTPGTPGGPGGQGAPPGAPGQPAPGGAGGAPAGPPSFAQQLPAMPPVASKAATDLEVARSYGMTRSLGRIGAGFVVGGTDSPKASVSKAAKLAAFTAKLPKAGA